MAMKTIVSILVTILLGSQLYAGSADTLKLTALYNSLLKMHPLADQTGLLDKSSQLALKNIKAAYLPQLNLNAQATYQSDVTEVRMGFPENSPISSEQIQLPEISKDMYALNLEMNQLIYDGGATKKSERLEKIKFRTNVKDIDIEFYKLKMQINNLYFTVLILDKQKQQIILRKRKIESRLENITSAIKSGNMLKSNAQELKAEVLKIAQQIEQHQCTDSGTETAKVEFTSFQKAASENV